MSRRLLYRGPVSCRARPEGPEAILAMKPKHPFHDHDSVDSTHGKQCLKTKNRYEVVMLCPKA